MQCLDNIDSLGEREKGELEMVGEEREGMKKEGGREPFSHEAQIQNLYYKTPFLSLPLFLRWSIT